MKDGKRSVIASKTTPEIVIEKGVIPDTHEMNSKLDKFNFWDSQWHYTYPPNLQMHSNHHQMN